jgi:hypothetical protein
MYSTIIMFQSTESVVYRKSLIFTESNVLNWENVNVELSKLKARSIVILGTTHLFIQILQTVLTVKIIGLAPDSSAI